MLSLEGRIQALFTDPHSGLELPFDLIHTADMVRAPGVAIIESTGLVVEDTADLATYFLQQIRPLGVLDKRLFLPHASLEHVIVKW